jgi:hypothetical protein
MPEGMQSLGTSSYRERSDVKFATVEQLDLLDNLHYILVLQHMVLANALWVMLHGRPPHQGTAERNLRSEGK